MIRRISMPAKVRSFNCVIDDRVLRERFSAEVTLTKKAPIRSSLQEGKIDLVDIFITPVSAQPLIRVHHHFVLYDLAGKGLYIVRDQRNKEDHRRPCTIWDLGKPFALQVLAAIKDLA
jgi:hypothetical protein